VLAGVLFRRSGDGFGAAVAEAVGVEVGQDLAFPGTESAAKSGNFWDRTGVEAVQDLDRDLAAVRRCGVVDGAQLLVALPGDVDFVGRIAGVKAGGDLGLLTLGEMFDTVAEERRIL
jgi:hypothetical protein